MPTQTTEPRDLDYLLAPDDSAAGKSRIYATPEAQAFLAEMQALRKLQGELDMAYLGAVVMDLFASHPWLASCRVKAWATTEFGDEGITYEASNVRIKDVVFQHSAAVPDELLVDGKADEDIAGDVLEDALSSEVPSFLSAARAKLPEAGGSEATFWFDVDRSSLHDLLQAAPPISGRAAFNCIHNIQVAEEH